MRRRRVVLLIGLQLMPQSEATASSARPARLSCRWYIPIAHRRTSGNLRRARTRSAAAPPFYLPSRAPTVITLLMTKSVSTSRHGCI